MDVEHGLVVVEAFRADLHSDTFPWPGTGRSIPAGYASCADASDADAAPLHLGEPGYTSGLDPDGNGVAFD
jgi:hypothetical protein